MSRKILVRISDSGNITVEADGFKGNGCKAATKAIEEALGKNTGRTRKHDFWRQDQRHQNQQPLGGGGL